MLQETDEIQQIAIFDIIPDPNNPREDIIGPEDLELYKSVKEVGILQHIMLRFAKKKGKYMVVFGHRRLQAAKNNEHVEIKAIVKELTDAQALEYQIIENLQRKDINPMEESHAFHRLIKKGLSTAEMIADRLGVSTKYVYDRLTLQKVLPEVQAAVQSGKISITHGKQFARLQTADQVKLLKNINLDNDGLLVSSIRSVITSMFRLTLNTAIFDIQDTNLVVKAKACTSCTKRSGCNILLFEDVQLDDMCFDSVCYESKVQAHIDEQIKKNQDAGKVVKLLSATWGVAKDGLLNKDNWRDEGDKETQTVGIFLEISSYCGYKIGQIINLKNDEIVAENKEEANVEVDKSKSAKHINYKEIFAGKCQDAILDAFNNSLIEFPQEAPHEIISLYCTDKFSNLLHSLERKITTILGIDMDSDGEYLSFKTYVRSKSLGEKLALIHLINSLDAAEGFSNYHGIKQDDIEKLQKELRSTGIDFFKIAADLNAPHPLFTPTEVAETTEA